MKLFNELIDYLQFSRMVFWTIFASSFIGIAGFYKTGRFIYGLFIFFGGIAINFIGFLFIKMFAGFSGSMYHSGSRERDHDAVIKGMYNTAEGLKLRGQYSQAEEAYLEILSEYPKEMDARYLLALLYERNLDKPEQAIKEYRKLRREIREKKIAYKYKDALDENIKQLEDFLKERV
ncbi:MAG: tetratricopeptide repeat protein [Nitrospirae bacterium]|nr:tetratricopeptide repeat protein [Nitrospirota bacterium]